jgi:hypothetical protein
MRNGPHAAAFTDDRSAFCKTDATWDANENADLLSNSPICARGRSHKDVWLSVYAHIHVGLGISTQRTTRTRMMDFSKR